MAQLTPLDPYIVCYCWLFKCTRVVHKLWPHIPPDTNRSGFLNICPYSLNIDDGMHDGVKLPEVMEWIVHSHECHIKGQFLVYLLKCVDDCLVPWLSQRCGVERQEHNLHYCIQVGGMWQMALCILDL